MFGGLVSLLFSTHSFILYPCSPLHTPLSSNLRFFCGLWAADCSKKWQKILNVSQLDCIYDNDFVGENLEYR